MIHQIMSDKKPKAVIETNRGKIKLELFKEDAPKTVENFIKYAEDGFYDGLIFHRVIKDFMIQGGGLKPNLDVKEPTYSPVMNEAEKSGHLNKRGTIAMARTSDPHSATSQFFINTSDNRGLDWDKNPHGYCVFGKVIEGMGVVDEIESVNTTTMDGRDDVPSTKMIIKSVTIE